MGIQRVPVDAQRSIPLLMGEIAVKTYSLNVDKVPSIDQPLGRLRLATPINCVIIKCQYLLIQVQTLSRHYSTSYLQVCLKTKHHFI